MARRIEECGGARGEAIDVEEDKPIWCVHLDIKHISQFSSQVKNPGPTACYRACVEMGNQLGVVFPDSTIHRRQIAKGETNLGIVIPDPAWLALGLQDIYADLVFRGVPIIAGVSYKDANYNRDGITDHFVLITGIDDERLYAQDPGRMPNLHGPQHPNQPLLPRRDDWNFEFINKTGRVATISMLVRCAE